MSIVKVRPFFRKILDDLGFIEHKDVFNYNNIAASQIDNGYHIMSGDIIPFKQSQALVEMKMETTIRLFFKGYVDPSSKLDEVLEKEEELIKKTLSVKCNALEDIKLTELVSSTREQFADSNDNIIISTMVFNSMVMAQPD